MRYLMLLCLCFINTNTYQLYRDRIPNGDLVPHPCKPNYLWKGVGHFNVQGGGDRNPFGEDFARFGRKWSKNLCEMDSDGDGRSNGEELGDPECVWTSGGGAPSAVASGHPGVCEPVETELCKATNAAAKAFWDICEEDEFQCDAINDPDVKDFTIAIEATRVPAQETTYACQLVKLPDDQQYHIIATKPAIDNHNVAHHIIVYGCDEIVVEDLAYYASPRICDAMEIYEACEHSVGSWTLGSDGYCEIPDVGTQFGRHSFNYAVIEIHWNNPTKETQHTDGSGLTIFYTPNLRKYDAEILTIGQQSLGIPPNVDTHFETAVCTSDCTNTLQEPLNIYRVVLHMHYLGQAGRVEQWRNGALKRVLVDQSNYSYDSPEYYMIDPPAVLKASDELKMFCKFKSTSRDEVTYYGEGMSDEMCFAFMSYYPKNAMTFCTSFGPLDLCDSADENEEDFEYEWLKAMGCNIDEYEDILSQFVTEAVGVCDKGDFDCSLECKEYFQAAYTNQSCFRNGIRFMFESYMQLEKGDKVETLIEFIRRCDKEIINSNPVPRYFDKRTHIISESSNLESGQSAASHFHFIPMLVMCWLLSITTIFSKSF